MACLELHVELLLRQGEDTDSSLGLAQLVVDADESLHSGFRAAGVLVLLVVQRLGKGMALLSQRTQSPATQTPLLMVRLVETV